MPLRISKSMWLLMPVPGMRTIAVPDMIEPVIESISVLSASVIAMS